MLIFRGVGGAEMISMIRTSWVSLNNFGGLNFGKEMGCFFPFQKSMHAMML